MRHHRVQRVDVAASAEEGEEVIGAPERLESELLSPLHDILPLRPANPLLALDHHAKLHIAFFLGPSQAIGWPDVGGSGRQVNSSKRLGLRPRTFFRPTLGNSFEGFWVYTMRDN